MTSKVKLFRLRSRVAGVEVYRTRACFWQYMVVSGYLDSPVALFQQKERPVPTEGGCVRPLSHRQTRFGRCEEETYILLL
jgi:hypothetical protein